jgi:hypothetical protein
MFVGLQASYELDKIGAVRRISQLEFPLRYVVSQDVIQAMYGAHVLVSEEKKHPYCKLGPSLFDNIILGRQVKRHGVWHSPFELYAISPFDYMLRPAAKGDVEKPGLILHRKLDEKIIDFFASI